MKRLLSITLLTLLITLTACDVLLEEMGGADSGTGNNTPRSTELYDVVRIFDGDTIDVERDGVRYRVRYIGVNTPERDEPCYTEATNANRALVEGQRVRLERDVSDTDQYDRLLRYVYVGDVFVNESLVRNGWAEVVRYDPDRRYWEHFRDLEIAAARDGRGCHPTGIFNDGSFTR